MTKVFISYNRADAAEARAIDAFLTAQGCATFLDIRDLGAGQLWLPDLEEQILHHAEAALVLVRPAGPGQYPAIRAMARLHPPGRRARLSCGAGGAARHARLAAAARASSACSPGSASLAAPPSPPPPRRAGHAGGGAAHARLGRAVRGAICPFRGLDKFEEEDHRIFMGRDAEARRPARHRQRASRRRRHGTLRFGKILARPRRPAAIAAPPPRNRLGRGGMGPPGAAPGRRPLESLVEALDPRRETESDTAFIARLEDDAAILGRSDDFLAELTAASPPPAHRPAAAAGG